MNYSSGGPSVNNARMTLPLTALGAWLLFTASAAHGAPPTLHACAAGAPPGPAWTELQRTADMRLYRRDTAGAPPEVAVRVRWRVRPRALYQLIWAYEHFAGVIPHVAVSDVLERKRHRVWVYQRLAYPAPARNRHYVLESSDRLSAPAEERYRVEWRLSKRFDLPRDTGAVAPEAFSGCWDIRPAADGLHALYRITLEPGGLVPHWLARHAMRGYLIELMTALQRELGSGRAGEPPPD